MKKDLERLIRTAKQHKFTQQEMEEQRRSFAYGNTHIENERITRDTVDREAESLNKQANEPRASKA